jgi:chromosome partitioning protein
MVWQLETPAERDSRISRNVSLPAWSSVVPRVEHQVRLTDRNATMPRIDLPQCVMPAINFKGGTGKTTVAIAIAEGICHLFRKRVVVVDCDFQCSASISLLGRKTLNDLIIRDATLDCQVQRLAGQEKPARLGAAAMKTRHCVEEAAELLYLLPASPDMPRRERQILSAYLVGADIDLAYERASTRIAELFRSLLDDFDFVIVDCPPGLTLFSEGAIRAADGLIIPTLPNEISFAAIDHLRTEIARTRPDRSLEDLLIGTVISKLRQRNGGEHHKQQVRSIETLLDRAAPGFQILKPYLPFCRELETTTWRDDEVGLVSFANRYGQLAEMIEQLVQEFATRCRTLMRRRPSKTKVAQPSSLGCQSSPI